MMLDVGQDSPALGGHGLMDFFFHFFFPSPIWGRYGDTGTGQRHLT